MKNVFITFNLLVLMCINQLNAQQTQNELDLSSVDTIADFNSKENKLKLYGTIYQSDGITPASDVILYIEQADEDGEFKMEGEEDSKVIKYRTMVKTDENGNYTIFTFIPGNDRRYNQMQELFPMIKEAGKEEYEIPGLLFDGDPLLSKGCRKRMAKSNTLDRILKPQMKDGMLIVQKNIILDDSGMITKKK